MRASAVGDEVTPRPRRVSPVRLSSTGVGFSPCDWSGRRCFPPAPHSATIPERGTSADSRTFTSTETGPKHHRASHGRDSSAAWNSDKSGRAS
jgi:hypothetical protein